MDSNRVFTIVNVDIASRELMRCCCLLKYITNKAKMIVTTHTINLNEIDDV